jgi:putative oxidoreductase
VTFIFHGFWNADPANFQNEPNQFLKNLALLGGTFPVAGREAKPAVESRLASASARATR